MKTSNRLRTCRLKLRNMAHIPSFECCTTFHRYPIFSKSYTVLCKVYTGYCGTSEIEHGLCACTVDNPLAKARGLSLRTGAQTMLYLSLIFVLAPGRVAQSVGHLTRKSGVLGSIPGLATYFRFSFRFFQEGQLSVTGESMCTKYWLTA